MNPELAGLFRGDLAAVGAALVIKDHTRSFEPVADLMQPDRLSAILEKFSTCYQKPERRAVASQWSKIYFSKLIVPSVAAALMLDWRLPLDLGVTGITLDEFGRPGAFCLTDAGLAIAAQTADERFSFVIDAHIAPVIGAIAGASVLSQKVLWSNAGNIVENVVSYSEKSAPAKKSVEQARLLLRARRLSSGEPNPLFEPVRYTHIGETQVRKRRVCCIRYLIPSLGYCKTCPLTKQDMG
ncbi:siderophore-iron reductase FhuF [Agrobacterium rosae]|uniref:Siderophore-iron reductase FhuF n=1 Tax=Agrobacterium rosae TaxID=1972867 RepID=A0AAE5RSX4_9HYPH|nr:siderophore-iron reductase FhuF [Agrobacterium rosae]KAA3507501.1 siderophore-iron reductase FhuF [Agrobacterium rosae]KAA3511975.1 siderophore-iron reductase FhuF [Agrobacterium rosae]MQB51305.1 siderophore-iron reductase FhuF [Agrobacterium rosae]POO48532.1 siderophore-iron reductase FhuF [Agrobacterium rosae]